MLPLRFFAFEQEAWSWKNGAGNSEQCYEGQDMGE